MPNMDICITLMNNIDIQGLKDVSRISFLH